MTLTYGSLFSGVGGLDLGLDRAGMECRWQVENDPYCAKVLAKHWPDIPRYGNIKELDPNDLEPVDLICGGFPCQPVSVAGKRLAQDDARWLWPEFFRLVRHLRPRYALIENVTGLFDRGFGDVLRDLASIGFDAEWSVLSACAMGAPHARERVFIVAYPASKRLEGRSWRSSTTRWEGSFAPRVSWTSTRRPRPRRDNGLSLEVDRRRALGNAVVPQLSEYVGNRIMEFASL